MKTLFKSMAIVALTATTAISETQGVTDTEVLIGSNQDMSGPFAAFGALAVQAAKIYFDEINAAGGVHGRQIRLVVEDHAYRLKQCLRLTNWLIQTKFLQCS